MADGANAKAPVATVPAAANVRTTRFPVPIFTADKFCMYMDEIKGWREVCGLPKNRQAMVLLLILARDSKVKGLNLLHDAGRQTRI